MSLKAESIWGARLPKPLMGAFDRLSPGRLTPSRCLPFLRCTSLACSGGACYNRSSHLISKSERRRGCHGGFPERIAALQPFWGTWLLDAPIGEGSYGKVYRIRREENGAVSYAALKWISLPQSQGDVRSLQNEGMSETDVRAYYLDMVRDLQNEVVLMNQLRGSSHVVSFEDCDFIERTREVGWDVLIRMELLQPLPERLQIGMAVEDVIKLGCDLCDALALCRRNRIIHRDIKPDNIFCNENGDYKLGDFGVARQMERTLANVSRKGTPFYMAPEIYLGRASDDSADQYSLGLVMHRLLNAQQVPFAAMDGHMLTHPEREAAFATRMQGTPIPPPLQGSERLAKAICRACAYQPKLRFESPDAFRDALQRAYADPEARQPLIVGNATLARSARSSVSLRHAKQGARKQRTGLKVALIAISSALAVVAGILIFLAVRGGSGGAAGPSPTPEVLVVYTALETPKGSEPDESATTLLGGATLSDAEPPAAYTEEPTDAPSPTPTAVPTPTPSPVPTAAPTPDPLQSVAAMPSYQTPSFPKSKKYKVYSGPGEHYLRGANGKAAVSTNDWIRVYGVDGDWALVEYEVSSSRYRQGYVAVSQLPSSFSAPALQWSWLAAYVTTDCAVTDDPSVSRESIGRLSAGADVWVLARYGGWLYVQGSIGGTLARGYVDAGAIAVP